MTPAALQAALRGDKENFIAATTPGGIEHQEKCGQIEQSLLETLPKEGTSGEDRNQFEAFGFVFGSDADDLFVNVQFPKGWGKKVTDHAMWSDLIDDKGRKRGSIFYKAAFYDRKAHCHLEQRYAIERYSNDNTVSVMDCGKRLHVIGSHAERDYKAMDALGEQAHKWLNQNYPDWQSAAAYWD